MRVHTDYNGSIFFAEQDRRGRRDEADVIIRKNGKIIFWKAAPKMKSEEELREFMLSKLHQLNIFLGGTKHD